MKKVKLTPSHVRLLEYLGSVRPGSYVYEFSAARALYHSRRVWQISQLYDGLCRAGLALRKRQPWSPLRLSAAGRRYLEERES